MAGAAEQSSASCRGPQHTRRCPAAPGCSRRRSRRHAGNQPAMGMKRHVSSIAMVGASQSCRMSRSTCWVGGTAGWDGRGRGRGGSRGRHASSTTDTSWQGWLGGLRRCTHTRSGWIAATLPGQPASQPPHLADVLFKQPAPAADRRLEFCCVGGWPREPRLSKSGGEVGRAPGTCRPPAAQQGLPGPAPCRRRRRTEFLRQGGQPLDSRVEQRDRLEGRAVRRGARSRGWLR